MNLPKNMRLSLKLPLFIGASLLLAVAAGLFGIYKLNQAVTTYVKVINVDYAQERMAAQMLVDFKTQVQEWKNTLLRGKDPKQLDKYWNAFQKHESDVTTSARTLQAALPDGEARVLVEKFAQAHAAMSAGYRKGFEAFKAANFESAAGDGAVKGMDRAPAELLEQVGDKIVANSAAAVAQAHEATQRATIISLGLMLAVCAVGALSAWLITRSLLRQLGGEPAYAAILVRRIADGDLTVDVHTRPGDTTSLLGAMKAMRDSLAQVVSKVRQSSDSIATGSTQIATGNADLSQRTEEQASNLQQTAASMEQLTSTVKQNSDTARQANQLATSASEAAAKGGLVVGQVVSTMEAITASSKKISDIISVIDGIAFQTNILALNAAVEAARAGEQGRGFAVVASEVRSLAQRSASAAKEIKALIGVSVENVGTGSKLVDDAGKSMENIVAQVKRVADLIAEISSASIEQTQGIRQVGDAINQLDQATQQNAALVEESAAAADSLKQQAAELAEVVTMFKLGDDDSLQAPVAQTLNRGAERRSPNRAVNVTRRNFSANSAVAKQPAQTTPAAESTLAKTGTDEWASF